MEQTYVDLASNVGLFVSVHNKSLPAFLFSNGISVAGSMETNLLITRDIYERLTKPYSDCVKDLQAYQRISTNSRIFTDYMLKLNVTEYNQELCTKLCYQGTLLCIMFVTIV